MLPNTWTLGMLTVCKFQVPSALLQRTPPQPHLQLTLPFSCLAFCKGLEGLALCYVILQGERTIGRHFETSIELCTRCRTCALYLLSSARHMQPQCKAMEGIRGD